MRNSFFHLPLRVCLTAMCCSLLCCNKKFDAPPPFEDPGVAPNATIMHLKALHTAGAIEEIKDDLVISGVVTADDRSGNFYKQVVIQDSTGGIVVRLDGTDLYTSYPVGRRLYIRCKGLYLGDYNKLVQLGGGADRSDPAQPQLSPVAANLQPQFVKKGPLNQPVAPRLVTSSRLTTQMMDSLQATLVQLEQMEFAAADTVQTFADTTRTRSAVGFVLSNCSGGSITLRSSSYASFAGSRVPAGNGTITGIYTIYGSTKQLNIRDTADLFFHQNRCMAGEVDSLRHLAEIRGWYKGVPTSLPAHTKIRGVVISDRQGKNIADNNIVLQEGTDMAGLLIRFSAPAVFDLGDELEIEVSGQLLEEYYGTLQLNNVPVSHAVKTGKNIRLAAKVVTCAQLNDASMFETLESTLVTVKNGSLSGGTNGAWNGTVTLQDATGSIAVFTRSQALFASTAYPAETIASFTGIALQNSGGYQLTCRNTRDAVTPAVTPPPADTAATPAPPPASSSPGMPFTGGGSLIALQTSPLVFSFNELAGGLPAGITVRTGATATYTGDSVGFTAAKTYWTAAAGGFKNLASATGQAAVNSQTLQDEASDRALGIRQVANTNASFPNGDPGAAIVFLLENTSGKTGLQLQFQLQSLDSSSGRTTAWQVDYAIGDQPASFTPVTVSGTLVTGGHRFSINMVDAGFGKALDNVPEKVWIRIVTLAASTGSGSRATTAVDEVRFSWQ